MKKRATLIGVVVATAAISAGIGAVVAATNDGLELSGRDAFLGVFFGISVGLVVLALIAAGAALFRARGVKLASPLVDLSDSDRRVVVSALRRAEQPDDPRLRVTAEREATRQVKFLRFVLSILPISLIGSVWQVVAGDSGALRIVGAVQALAFCGLLSLFWFQWRRAKGYLNRYG